MGKIQGRAERPACSVECLGKAVSLNSQAGLRADSGGCGWGFSKVRAKSCLFSITKSQVGKDLPLKVAGEQRLWHTPFPTPHPNAPASPPLPRELELWASATHCGTVYLSVGIVCLVTHLPDTLWSFNWLGWKCVPAH